MAAANPPKLIAVGGVCATGILRVATVPALPAKVLANRMCRIADGTFIRESLAAEGLDVSGLRMVPGGRTSQAAVIVDERGQRLVVPFHDPDLDAATDWLPLGMLDGAGMVHCDVRWPAGAEAALRASRMRGIPTMIDGDVAPEETRRWRWRSSKGSRSPRPSAWPAPLRRSSAAVSAGGWAARRAMRLASPNKVTSF